MIATRQFGLTGRFWTKRCERLCFEKGSRQTLVGTG